ncbi:MAG: Global nitrogen regulator [Syntrophorhabdus sp. PtaB.Bin184]|jgi:CRP/FNR family cyclic AMP-dependent transcriptional regulator|nr:MAG: Global nitrogen regulator [Syntrophorhabdus sp. PtaB.Bin184]
MEGREGAPDSPYLTDNLKDYPTELNLLSENSTKRSCSAGEMIYIQSEASRPEFYLIEKGRVKIALLSRDGSERTVIIQERNTLFGYAAAFDGHPYFHTATALEPTELRVIPIATFLALNDKHPRLSAVIIAAFARVTRMLILQIENDSFMDARRRVAHMLCKLASEVGQTTPRGILIAKKVTQEDLGNLTGLSRVSVSLALNHFEEQDLLRKKRNMIEIFNVEELRKVVGIS